ncbi:MAG: hypothetical protein ACI857_001799 [Arenicella sp.]|jgi:hypothetical protein
MEQIYQYFNIKSTDLKAIFDAINTEKGIQDWWTAGTKKEDDVLHFTFNGNYTKSFKITNLLENKQVDWECIAGHDDWIGTKIEFKLVPKEDSTDISFRHYGWADQTEHFASCNYHWGLYMKSLKALIEDGEGTPHKN